MQVYQLHNLTEFIVVVDAISINAVIVLNALLPLT